MLKLNSLFWARRYRGGANVRGNELVEGGMFLEGHGSLARVAYEAEQIREFLFCNKVRVFIVEHRDILGGQKMLHIWNRDADGLDAGLGQILYKGSRVIQMFKRMGHGNVGVARQIKCLAVTLKKLYRRRALLTVADI
jgi:hypothetical protein